jgi:hypothetical protein
MQQDSDDDSASENDFDPRMIMMRFKQQAAQKLKKNEKRVARIADDTLKRISQAAEEAVASSSEVTDTNHQQQQLSKLKKFTQRASAGKLGGNLTKGEFTTRCAPLWR